MRSGARGLFITFEGGEGAGKSTQIQHLARYLSQTGISACTTREPGGSPLAEAIREVLLSQKAASCDAITQALLFAAARRDHCLQTIRLALARGEIVLCDRFADSTRAYQGTGDALAPHDLEQLIALATDHLVPDLTILLDLDPHIGLARAKKRRSGPVDPFEQADLAFHHAVRARFLALAKAEPARFVLLDAGLPELALAAAIREVYRSKAGALGDGA
jgi:dTMP kinase